jgi:hypothetical protein
MLSGDREAGAALAAAARNHILSVCGLFARKEAVRLRSFSLFRLVGSFWHEKFVF